MVWPLPCLQDRRISEIVAMSLPLSMAEKVLEGLKCLVRVSGG